MKKEKNTKIKIPLPKNRKPVQNRPNSIHKTKNDYDRKKNKDILQKELEDN